MPSLRTLSGRLVFSQAGATVPLHNLPIRVRVHRLIGEVVDTETDLNGNFSVTLTPDEDLRLILQDTTIKYTESGELSVEREDLCTLDVPVSADSDDLGTIYAGFWPYRTDFPVARAGAVHGKIPQSYSSGFQKTLAFAFAKTVPSRAILEAETLLGQNHPDVDSIQERQPESQTLSVDKETPGKTRSDAWLGDQLLNGFDIALRMGRDAENPARFRVRIAWGELPARTDGPGFDNTDVDVVLESKGESLVPVQIRLVIRVPQKQNSEGSWAEEHHLTVMPGDSD
jgi:hypothetical protein